MDLGTTPVHLHFNIKTVAIYCHFFSSKCLDLLQINYVVQRKMTLNFLKKQFLLTGIFCRLISYPICLKVL